MISKPPFWGVDRFETPSRIRRSRTGQGRAAAILRSPSFLFLFAEPPPQPPACARYCRERVRLRKLRAGPGGRHADGTRRSANGADFAPPAGREAPPPQPRPSPREANPRRARGADRPPGRRRALSLGRNVSGQRIRLLRARLLGVRTAGRRASTQLVRTRAVWPPRAARAAAGRRPALLLWVRARRSLCRPRPHGARAAFRKGGRGGQARPL